MPSCTDTPEIYDVWMCPHCPKQLVPLNCWSWQLDRKNVRYKAPCTNQRCVSAGAHFDHCSKFVLHLIEKHKLKL